MSAPQPHPREVEDEADREGDERQDEGRVDLPEEVEIDLDRGIAVDRPGRGGDEQILRHARGDTEPEAHGAEDEWPDPHGGGPSWVPFRASGRRPRKGRATDMPAATNIRTDAAKMDPVIQTAA
jgi:hypothetical protein